MTTVQIKINKEPKKLICGECKKYKKKIIRKGGSEEVNKDILLHRTFGFTCTNKECSLSLNMHKIKTWVLAKE